MQEKIEILGKLVEEGENILNDRYKDLNASWARSDRWESRCKDLLAQHISNEEAKKFEDEGGTGVSLTDPVGNFVSYIRAKINFLKSLQEDIVNNPDYWRNKLAVAIPSMKVTREGVFFEGQYFDVLQFVTEILSQAQQSITIIDNYLNEDVLNLLTSKKPDVEVRILTKDVPPALKTAANAFKKQYGKLSIRISTAFHDRFVIVDDHNFYHFGASLKDLGHRGFMLSRIEEPEVINALRTKWAQEWANATIAV